MFINSMTQPFSSFSLTGVLVIRPDSGDPAEVVVKVLEILRKF